MERFDLGFDTKTEEFLRKASAVSYYIATYNAVNDELGLANDPVSVDEIFDFISDLRHEGGATSMPSITKTDISLIFRLLMEAGIGKPTTPSLAVLSN